MFERRPAAKIVSFFIVGILAGWYVPFSILYVPIALSVFLFIAYIVANIPSETSLTLSNIILCFLLLLLGVWKISLDTQYISNNHISRFINPNQEIILSAIVIDQPTKKRHRMQFVAEVDSLIHPISRQKIEGEILVTVLSKERNFALFERLTYGTKIQLQGYLEQPQQARNPGDFDYRKYLRLKDIHAQCIIKNTEHINISGEGGNWFFRIIVFPSRKWMSTQLDTFISSREGNFLKGLLLGDRSEIDSEAKTAFINAGVMHILAVSGSNVLFIILIFSSIFSAIRLPAKLSFAIQCFALVFYIFLTGESASVTRAVIMGIIYLIGKEYELFTDNYNTIATAALIVLLFDARQLFDAGFQLSFAAVFSLAFFYPKLKSLDQFFSLKLRTATLFKFLWVTFSATFAATLGTLPFTTLYFEKISVIGLLTNLFVIPFSGLLLALGVTVIFFAAFAPWIAQVYASTTKVLSYLFLETINYTGHLSFASFDLKLSYHESLAFYAALFFLCTSFQRQFQRRIFIFGLFLMNFFLYKNLYVQFIRNAEYKYRITVLDVGQGDALHIKFPNGENFLVDAGPKSLTYDAGEKIVVPYLKRQNIFHLNGIIVSHPHSDHLGGVPAVLREISVDTVFDSAEPANSNLFMEYHHVLDSMNIAHKKISKGMSIGNFLFVKNFILHPTETFADTSKTPNLNNGSVVFKSIYKNTSVLFSGDAEKEAEDIITYTYGDFLKSSLLKVGHHGSRTSTSKKFLESVRPHIALISVGVRNKFRHPSKTTLKHLRENNVQYFRTDEEGAIVFESDGNSWKRINWREE
ncbi:MAG: DNA internalization-related competence protein ComEC/Rec2 [Ignavibacteria bacterium]|nr:DNA internalization-related competence protein ComEC/Rec2 [Ignavibacteria bacterium]